MRCTKCGFISFDYPPVCVGCKTDLSDLLQQFEGTTSQGESPFFLGPALGPLSEEGDIETQGASSGFEEAEGIGSGIDFEPDEADFELGTSDAEADFQLGSSDEEAATMTVGGEEAEFDFLQAEGEETGEADFELSEADEAGDFDFEMTDEAEDTGEAEFDFEANGGESDTELGGFDFDLAEESGDEAVPAGQEEAEFVFDAEESSDFALTDESSAHEAEAAPADVKKHRVGLEDLDLADLDLSADDTAPAGADLDFSFDDDLADDHEIEFLDAGDEEEKS
jgi:hypothetical protein